MYFDSVSNSLFEAQKDKMRSYGASIASKAIHSHMQGVVFDPKNTSNYKIGMYSKRYNLLYGEYIDGLEFKKEVFQKNDALYVIDRSAQLHLGIKYIVLKDETIFETIKELRKKVIMYTILAMVFISIIGYFLSKIFLKPIANERERLDRFIKDTTHELNTPLSALLMSTSMLKNEDQKAVERINISAKRLSNIYNDLCYLLKHDTDQKLKIEDINIKDIINLELTLIDGYAKSKKISINTKLENLIVKIDKESALRLINNIITNALKYSKPNSSIDITMNKNILTIKDQGIGIKKDQLKNIQKRYYRANDSEGGFGIGLDIVTSICSKYDIKLNIESIENIGTTIKLEF